LLNVSLYREIGENLDKDWCFTGERDGVSDGDNGGDKGDMPRRVEVGEEVIEWQTAQQQWP
jgi:hypothetical protein